MCINKHCAGHIYDVVMLSFSNSILLVSVRSRFLKIKSLLDKKVKKSSNIVLFASITLKINNFCLKKVFN